MKLKKTYFLWLIVILLGLPLVFFIANIFIIQKDISKFAFTEEKNKLETLQNDIFKSTLEYSKLGKQILNEVIDKIIKNPSEGKKFTFSYQQQFDGNVNFHTSDIKFPIFFHRNAYNNAFGRIFTTVDNTIKRFYQLFNLFPLYYYQHSSIEALFFISCEKIAFYFPNNELREKFSEKDNVFKSDYFVKLVPKQNPEKNLVYTNIFTDHSKKFQVISVLSPVYDKNKKDFLGSLGVDFDIKYILEHIKTYDDRECGRAVFIVDSSRNLYGVDKELFAYLGIFNHKMADKQFFTLEDLDIPERSGFINKIDSQDNGELLVSDSDKSYYISFKELKPFPLKICGFINPEFTIAANSSSEHFFNSLNTFLIQCFVICFLFVTTAIVLFVLYLKDFRVSQQRLISHLNNIYNKDFTIDLPLEKTSMLYDLSECMVKEYDKLSSSDVQRKNEVQKDEIPVEPPAKEKLSITSQLFNEGLALIEQEDYSKALIMFNHILELEPNNYKAIVNLGLAHYKQKDYYSALTMWDRALVINPALTKVKKNAEKLRQFLKERQELEAEE